MFTATELAKALGKSPTAAHRLMDPDYSSKRENIEGALAILGHRLVIETADITNAENTGAEPPGGCAPPLDTYPYYAHAADSLITRRQPPRTRFRQ
ncbi:hypothetical protein [Aquisalimonas sp.]|uniref:hypothetical protein n=1 Tax=Aquisalimonas sp. TaxID=1872621 RepID=UPI0025BFB680|nr:hypothetical protein [Aquisalimonas sp.]